MADVSIDKTTAELLSELEKTREKFWNISRKTGLLLNMLIKIANSKNALEVGTSNGYSGIWISKALKETGGRLTTIEFFEKRQSVAVENFKTCGVLDIITPVQGDACEVIASFDTDKKFDFVFIDAAKREYIKYFELIKPRLAAKAIIAADNITTHTEKVQPFIDAIDADAEFQYTITEPPDGVLIAYRNI